ncbi:hypothetical protein GCK32_013466 [Trichostrongylus colubriformis]|uniref:Uncharacterized protein n=1 Tax=Trichostrongylus colubriformis TaxID=6319 RepID=A0AAN8FBP2_TRICO
MFYTTILSLIFLLTAQARLQGRPLGFDRSAGGNSYDERDIKNGMPMLGDYGLTISAGNGTTTVTAMIAGKRYTRTYPDSKTIYTNTFVRRQEGRFYEVLQITVNDKSYTYKTVDGKTTVFDRKGRVLKNGGPFHVTSTRRT